MAFYSPYLLVSASILGIIRLSYEVYQTRCLSKGSKIRFKRFLSVGVIFVLSAVSSGLSGILRGDKRTSRSILLGDITQRYEAACDKKKKEQALAQRMKEFTACYKDMSSIFIGQEKYLTGKNMKKFTRFYQNLSKKQQREVQEKYKQVREDVQYFKDMQTGEACCSLPSDITPFSTNE